ncbi:MAG: sulfatase-like hydrolase/transferase [Planctomycetota bacterium]
MSAPYRLRPTRWIVAHAIVMLGLFLLGFALFAIFAQRLDNRFAEAARRDHLGTVIAGQLSLLPAYGIIALLHALVSFPFARRLWARRTKREAPEWRPRRLRVLASAAIWSAIVFALSLGPMTYVGPGSLDNLARMATRAISPAVDLYVFLDWHLREVFTAIFAAGVLIGLGDLVGAAWSRLRGARASTQISVGLAVGAVVGGAFLAAGILLREPPRENVAYPNIVIIGSDSLRYDHLGAHGYRREGMSDSISPNIDAFAREAIDFEHMHVATASTLESWATFLTGKWPANHGLRYMFATKEQAEAVSHDRDTLPRVLAERGYHTAVVGDWAANCFSLADFGFEERRTSDVQNLDVFLAEVSFKTHVLVTHYFSNLVGEALVPGMAQATGYMNPGDLTRRFRREFDRASSRGKPFFGVLFLACAPAYASSHPYNSMYCDPDYRGPNRFQIHFDVDDFIQHGFADDVSPEEKRQIIGLYDGGVTMFDDHVGALMDWMRETGLDRNTIVVVTSDHGDDLYEPGTTLGHGTNFFGGDQTTRIPFFLRLPGGQFGGRAMRGLARNVDVLPTLVELANAARSEDEAEGTVRPPVRMPEMDGASLVPFLTGESDDTGLAAFAETCYLFYPKKVPGEDVYAMKPADRTLKIDPDFRNLFVLDPKYHDYVIETKDRMMRTPRWKLIHIKGKRGPIWRFYDMMSDPGQTTDLSGVDLPFAPLAEMKADLLHWMETGEARPWRGGAHAPR